MFLGSFKVSRSSKVFLFQMTWPSQQFADVFPCYTIEIQFSLKLPLVLCFCTPIFAQPLNHASPVYFFAVLVRGPPVCVYYSLRVLRQLPEKVEGHVPDLNLSTCWLCSGTEECTEMWVGNTLGTGCVFFFTKVNFRFSQIAAATLFLHRQPPYQCCDFEISFLEAHLSWVNGTADIMGSLCEYAPLNPSEGLRLLEKTHIHSWLDALKFLGVPFTGVCFLKEVKIVQNHTWFFFCLYHNFFQLLCSSLVTELLCEFMHPTAVLPQNIHASAQWCFCNLQPCF